MTKVVVIGAGSWGTALAALLANKPELEISLWSRSSELVSILTENRENLKYLPGVPLATSLQVTNDWESAVADKDIVVIVTPSHAVRSSIVSMRPYLKAGAIIVTASKGLEPDSLLTMTQVVTQELPTNKFEIAVLSGPNHAEEVGRNLPTTTVIASQKRIVAEKLQDIFMTPLFRVYTNPDVIGVELGGALKNIIALCAGIIDGLGLGDNTKSALMTRGLAEIARLGISLGARPLTFAGLSGVGDLIVTCTSQHSRNRRAGISLAQGKSVEEIQSGKMVVEGIRSTLAAYKLGQKYQVQMPITEQAYRVLYQGVSPNDAVKALMGRAKTHETEEIVQEW